MSAHPARPRTRVSRPWLLFIAGGVCSLQLIQGCGSAGTGGLAPSAAGAGAGAGASAGVTNLGGVGPGGSDALGGSSTQSGGASSGAAASVSAGGAPSSGGGAGTGGAVAGAGNCSTPPPASALIGWASQPGMNVATTTGGGTAAPQTVTTLAALASAVAGTAPAVVYVTGKLAAGKVSIGSNKTIAGLCGAEIHGHLGLSGSSNVIIRNLKIVGYAVGNCALDPDYDSTIGCSSGNDALTIIDQAHHIWVDHCDISDGTDGNLDTTQGSDFVTVSWTKFHYTSRADNTGSDSTGGEGHRFSNLIGAADNVAIDVGHLNVTWHHDWWADNVNQRMPRTRAGKIHLFNDLFTAKGDGYCTNAGQGASLLVENSIYSGVKNPFQVASNALTLLSTGNTFPGCTGTETGAGNGFTPPYAYTPDSTTNLQATIQANAGPQ